MLNSLYLKVAQAAKMADNYQLADPKLSRIEALQKAFKVQKDTEE